ncbi:MAG: hypothetical protein PUD72_03700 [Oscillospiraceae bacterium]|nr:hypothetical protein [Oscillospiraceae bacterium]
MNKNEGIKRTVYGILTVVCAALFVSPVDILTGVQVDDIGYALGAIITLYMNYKASLPVKEV